MLNKPFSRDETTQRSLKHSIRDGVAFAAMGGASESYFSAYAVLLKASAPQIGLLASLPPMLAAFAQLLSVWLGQTTGWRKGIIVFGALLQVGALIAIALLPSIYPDLAFPLLLACVVVYFVGPNIGAPLWGSMMGAIVPETVRGRFFAARTRYSSIASFSMLIAAGGILQLFDVFGQPLHGFLAIFAIAIAARLASAWFLHCIVDPPVDRADPLYQHDGLPSPTVLRANPNFLRFSLFFAAMQFSVAISGPFVVVYLLRDLEYSYMALTANTAASVLVQFLVLARWGRLGDLFGNRIVLRVTGFGIPFVPLLWVLSSDFYYLLLVQAMSGLIWSGFSLAASNYLFDLTPQTRRAGLMATHNLMSGVAVFAGASVGGFLALALPTSIALWDFSFAWGSVFYGVFLASSLMRLIVAASFLPHLEEVRDVRRMTYHGLIFRVTRFSPISGLIIEVVSRRRRDDDEGDEGK